MRWEEAYDGWRTGRLNQEEAAQLLGICDRSFRRYVDRYKEDGLDGLRDKRISEVSQRRAPVDEVLRLETLYRQRYDGWTVAHFFERYQGKVYSGFFVEEEGTFSSLLGVKETLKKRGIFSSFHSDRGSHYWVTSATVVSEILCVSLVSEFRALALDLWQPS